MAQTSEVLSGYSKTIWKKAESIKAIFFDVDGVMTDGRITYDDSGREIKSFNVKDGYIMSHLKKAGILTGVISGRESKVVSDRAAELKLDFCHLGVMDKFMIYEKLLHHYKLKNKHVCYIGDDINDLKTLSACGLSVCPADALPYVQTRVDVVSRHRGGRGVIREAADLILDAQGLLAKIIER